MNSEEQLLEEEIEEDEMKKELKDDVENDSSLVGENITEEITTLISEGEPEISKPSGSPDDEGADNNIDELLKKRDDEAEELIIEQVEKPEEIKKELTPEEIKTNINIWIKSRIIEYRGSSNFNFEFSLVSNKIVENLLFLTGFLNHAINLNKLEECKIILEKDLDIINSSLNPKVLSVYSDVNNKVFPRENNILLELYLAPSLNNFNNLILKYLSYLPNKKTNKHLKTAAGFGMARAESWEQEEVDMGTRFRENNKFIVEGDEVRPAD